jgi:hypothetical protein
MKKRGPVFWLLIVISLAGLAASVRILWKRSDYERANNTVQIVLDYPSLLALLLPTEKPQETIDRIKKLGVEDFGVYEFKAKELIENGDLSISHNGAAPNLHSADVYGGAGLVISEPSRIGRVSKYLNAYFGEGACPEKAVTCYIPDVGDKIEDLSFGLRVPGFDISMAPRFFNTPFENRKSIKVKMAVMDIMRQPSVVLFDGDSVLGWPNLSDFTAHEIKRRAGWNYGYVEMVEQDGAPQLARKMPSRTVVATSISEDELLKTPPAVAVARYRRAARERGVRVLYVRFYTSFNGETPHESLEDNMKYLGGIIDGIKADGFKIGRATPLPPFLISKKMQSACVAGAIAFTGLLCWIGFGLPCWLTFLCAAGGGALIFLLPESASLFKYTIKLASLGTAALVPGLAVAALFLVGIRRKEDLIRPGVIEAVARWIAVCALTLAAGVFVAAMLSHREYFLRLNVFTGVKIAFLLPLAAIALLYIYHTGEKFGDFFSSPIRYGDALAALFVMAALAIYVLRSGNESGGTLTGSESSLRMHLESFFAIRPRFKEFAIGHPALILAGLVPLGKKRYIGLLLLIFAVIGQISILNTYCHLHTPILISYQRTLLGIIAGLAVGLSARAGLKILLWIWRGIVKPG